MTLHGRRIEPLCSEGKHGFHVTAFLEDIDFFYRQIEANKWSALLLEYLELSSLTLHWQTWFQIPNFPTTKIKLQLDRTKNLLLGCPHSEVDFSKHFIYHLCRRWRKKDWQMAMAIDNGDAVFSHYYINCNAMSSSCESYLVCGNWLLLILEIFFCCCSVWSVGGCKFKCKFLFLL